MSADRITEDIPRWRKACPLGFACLIADDTALEISLPRPARGNWGEPVHLPFVAMLGGVNLHMDRPEVARLHDLLGRALAATEGGPS